jgi:hypothetical protein
MNGGAWELEAREEIRDVVARYNGNGDAVGLAHQHRGPEVGAQPTTIRVEARFGIRRKTASTLPSRWEQTRAVAK